MVIHGARIRATLGPLADELLVFPSTVRIQAEGPSPLAFAFALPCATPGLKFMCRESFDYNRSPRDYPLGSRFEEMHAIVVFNRVLVPWERVFLKSDARLCNLAYAATNAVVHMLHQVVCKNIAKAEFVLGIACLVAETMGSQEAPQVQEKIAECIVNLELMKACRRAAEADAGVDQWGLMCPRRAPLDVARNVFPKMYPRMKEILQQLGSSNLMMIPPESVYESPLEEEIGQYLARDRVKLFRLAWDVSCSAFGGRQELYERFFFGDPERMASALYQIYDKKPPLDRVREFLRD